MIMRTLLAPMLAGVLIAGPALAQDRGAAERQTLTDLAYALGESHALRQMCAGPNDQYWRDRMLRLTQVEAADQAFDAALRERFNTGFTAGQNAAPLCGALSRRAEAAAASRGQTLAQKLSVIMRRAPTQPQDENAASEP